MMRGFIFAIVAVSVLSGPSFTLPGAPSAAEGAPESRFVIGNTLWTLVHEMAHALISEFDVALLGKEEDAADCIATIALLHGHAEFGIPNQIEEVDFLVSTAEAWRAEWELERRHGFTATYADTHSLDIQRFYNILCLLYGGGPDKYGDLAVELGLPFERALACLEYEHEQALRAVNYLITMFGPFHNPRSPGRRISVVYEASSDRRHDRLASLVRNARVAELVAEHTERLFVLPEDIQIVFMSCLGQETAFWREDRKEIVFCYELLERFEYLYRATGCLEDEGLTEKQLDECLAR